jgi:hypothetical protein
MSRAKKISGSALGLCPRSFVRKSNQPLRVSFVFKQCEITQGKAGKQSDAFTRHNRNDTEPELVHQNLN